MNAFLGLQLLTGLMLVTATLGGDAQRNQLQSTMEDEEALEPHGSAEPMGAQMCYDGFGCFSRFPPGIFPEPPWFVNPSFSLFIPTSAKAAHVYRYDATIGDEDEETKKSLRNPSRKLVFVVHGFGETGNQQWVQDVKDAKTQIYGNNVIVVDWSNGARKSTLYLGAAANSVLVGRIVAQLCLQFVQKYGIPMANVEFVGFSLGAQVSTFFAREMFEKTGQKIGRISALDCAAPSFESKGIYPSRDHAIFIEALHTASGRGLFQGRVGISIDYGHVDYYINGGIHQPGCNFLDVTCSHKRAHEYYVDAIKNRDKCLYRGFPCDSVQDANKGTCHPVLDPTFFIGQATLITEHKILYLWTRDSSPFCIPDPSL